MVATTGRSSQIFSGTCVKKRPPWDDFRTLLASEFSDSPFLEDIGKVVADIQIWEKISQLDKSG
jgi:hypothetical protein